MIKCDNSLEAMSKQKQSVPAWVIEIFLVALLVGMAICTNLALADKDPVNAARIEEVFSLQSLLARVSESFPGKVLEVELEREEDGEEDIWVYEVKLLADNGRVLKLEYDAISLKLLKIKGKSEN